MARLHPDTGQLSGIPAPPDSGPGGAEGIHDDGLLQTYGSTAPTAAAIGFYRSWLTSHGWTVSEQPAGTAGLTASKGKRTVAVTAELGPRAETFINVCGWNSQPASTECAG